MQDTILGFIVATIERPSILVKRFVLTVGSTAFSTNPICCFVVHSFRLSCISTFTCYYASTDGVFFRLTCIAVSVSYIIGIVNTSPTTNMVLHKLVSSRRRQISLPVSTGQIQTVSCSFVRPTTFEPSR